MSFLKKYAEAFHSSKDLDIFIKKNLSQLFDYYGLLNHKDLTANRDDFKQLSLKINVVSQLNFSSKENEVFLNLILNASTRLGDRFVFEQFYNILKANNLSESQIIKASANYMINVKTSDDLLLRLDSVLILLEDAFLNEADDEEESIASLINFYALFVKDFCEFSESKVEVFRNRLVQQIDTNEFKFIKRDFLKSIVEVNIDYNNDPYTEIQIRLDNLLGRNRSLLNFITGFLLETGTVYSDTINKNKHSIYEILKLSKNLYKDIKDDNLYYSLGRGTSILEKEEQLLAYMYSYGSMHIEKMNDAITFLPRDIKNIALTDWGCGQGIASKIFLEQYGVDAVCLSTLIEPSECALKRASLHINQHVSSIKTINKDFDSLIVEDLIDRGKDTMTNIHLFSNIIDVNLFSLTHLIKTIKMSFTGVNYFVIVSPFIDTTKTERINLFVREIIEGRTSTMFINEDKRKGEWQNNWTKVVRVFSVDL